MTGVTLGRLSAETAGWRNSHRKGGHDSEWFPLLEVGPTGQLIGVTRTEVWVTSRLDGSVAVPNVDTDGLLLLLRLTELDPNTFREAIRLSLVESGFSQELLKKFPVKELIEFALNTRSNHWISHALDWMGALGRSSDHVATLQDMVNGRWAEQKLRHRAQRFLRDLRGSR